MKIKHLAVLILSLAATLAHAQVPLVRLYTNLGFSFGGDTLASGAYTDGERWTIKAGEGLLLAVGADFRVAERLSVRTSIGYHRDSTNASNGEVSFNRTPVEVLALYEVHPQVVLGGGLRKATNARIHTSGVAGSNTSGGSYDSSVGLVLEGIYFFNAAPSRTPQYGINLRVVNETFEQNIGSTGKKDGTHVALGFVFMY